MFNMPFDSFRHHFGVHIKRIWKIWIVNWLKNDQNHKKIQWFYQKTKMSTFWRFGVDWLVFQKRPKLCNLTLTNVIVVQTKKLTQFIQMFVANILTSYLWNIIQWNEQSAQKFAVSFECVRGFSFDIHSPLAHSL